MEPNSFYIETYGCTSNKADSNIIVSILKNSNYVQTDLENAEFLIINTCAVKEQTENKIKARLKELFEMSKSIKEKHVIIAGCLPHITPNYIKIIKGIIPNFAVILDLDNFDIIPSILKRIQQGESNIIIESESKIDKSEYLINYSRGKITGIIPISEGCLGSCAYCCVKNARGNLKCYDPKYILKNVEHQLNQGIRQLYLTSQDCGTYEHQGTTLFDLIRDIVSLDHEFFLRIGMVNPSFLLENVDQLIKIYKLDKVYRFLHVPIQSGSNRILGLMNRPYTIPDIIDKLDLLRKTFPDLTISTDIICGFPEESEYDFFRTINLIKWLKPEILNISKFTARPGTKAKSMTQVSSRTIKERSIRLSTVFRNSLTQMNKEWLNWEGIVLVLHPGTEPDQAFGRNSAYKNIFLSNYDKGFGSFFQVKIVKVDGFNLYGEIKA